jgi:hypothetical protein
LGPKGKSNLAWYTFLVMGEVGGGCLSMVLAAAGGSVMAGFFYVD